MRTEEAIQELRYPLKRRDNPQDRDKFLDAIDMALSALRAQQETERNEPLTLAEAQLLIQNQEPVWRSGLTLRDASSKWKIARFCTGEYVSWQDGTSDRFENYGISWLAYSRRTVGEGAKT